MKMFLDPPTDGEVEIQDSAGRRLSPAEVRGLADRRVKWTKRDGSRLAVMLYAPTVGARGTKLYFPDPGHYDRVIRKVFKEKA